MTTNEISIHSVININETEIIFLPLPLWPADVSTLLKRSLSVCNLCSCDSYLLIVASSDDILWSDSERNSLWRLWGATKMIGSCCHEGCPMNGRNEIPKMLCTRHKVSQGTPCDTLWLLLKIAWISLCSCIGHVYVKGKVVQFTDEMRFDVNVTKCLPGTKCKQNSYQTVPNKVFRLQGKLWYHVIPIQRVLNLIMQLYWTFLTVIETQI